jgi:hypothetical protein
VSISDEPSNINWQNIPYSESRRCCRKIFAVFISFLVILLTFGIVIIQQKFISSITEDFDPNINCSNLGLNDREVIIEFINPSIPKKSKVKASCFCQKYLIDNGIFNTQSYSIQYENRDYLLCSDWMNSWIKYQGASTAVIVIIPVVNLILSFILQCI